MRQRELWPVIAPLAVVPLALILAQNVLNRMLTGFPTATDELAGLGVGMFLVLLFDSPAQHLDQMTLAFGRGRRGFVRMALFASLVGGAMAALAAWLMLAPSARNFVLFTLQRAPDEGTAARAAFVVLWLAPLPIVESLARVMRGGLVLARRTHWVTVVATSSRAISLVLALAILGTPWVKSRPLIVPVAALWCDALLRMAFYAPILAKVVWPKIEPGGPLPSWGRLVRFAYPLALTSAMMAASRPLINAVIASLPDGKIGLAALAIVFPMSNLLYGWLNDIRLLPPVFGSRPGGDAAVRRFAVFSVAAVAAAMAALYLTPLCAWGLRRVMNVEEALVGPCRSALMIFCLFPFVVAIRAYLQGLCIARERTQAMTWSGPFRVVAILITLYALAAAGGKSAALGAAALWMGFVAEAATIYWFLERVPRSRPARIPVEPDWESLESG